MILYYSRPVDAGTSIFRDHLRIGMQIAVIGNADAGPQEREAAYAVGRLIARNGAVLVCGESAA